MLVIGISGKQQAGKTETVKHLYRCFKGEGKSVTRVTFARLIKQIAMNVFGATKEQVMGTDAQKNEPLDNNFTAREIMKQVGLFFRTLDPLCFVRAYKLNVAQQFHKDFILTDDVRYPEEVKAIQELGGVVIRLTRNPNADQHETETALDDYEGFDFTLDNSEMTVQEQNNAIWGFLKEKGHIPRNGL